MVVLHRKIIMAFLNKTKNHDEISEAKNVSLCITMVNIGTLYI